MSQDTTILRHIYDYANRANPYPLWAKLRENPVSFQEDGSDEAGTYVVSTYREIMALPDDPRISSDLRKSVQTGGRPQTSTAPYLFISLDPPEHDRLRGGERHFGPPECPEYLQQLRSRDRAHCHHASRPAAGPAPVRSRRKLCLSPAGDGDLPDSGRPPLR